VPAEGRMPGMGSREERKSRLLLRLYTVFAEPDMVEQFEHRVTHGLCAVDDENFLCRTISPKQAVQQILPQRS
jgi:hypothetical protein